MERTITICARAEAILPVDQVLLYVTLLGKDPNYENAASLEAKRLKLLEQAVKDCGFSQEAFKTNSYDIQTEYESYQDNGVYRNRLVGFLCRQELLLKMPFQTEILSKVLTAISGCGAQAEIRLEFTVKDSGEAEDALLQDAVRSGRARAQLLCDAAGVKLGSLLQIEHNSAPSHAVSETRFDAANTMLASKRIAVPEMAPNGVTLQEEVQLTWAIVE